MQQQLYELFHQCTARVSLGGKAGHGTGFFVAPGLILTCAHVVKDAQAGNHMVEVYWNGQQHPAELTNYVPDADLALLHVDLVEHPCVFLREEATPFDTLYSYGYPDDHVTGDPATFLLEGKAGERGEQLKLKTGQVRPGLSGAPLLNVRTGSVCGVIQLTRDRASDLGGRAIPTTMVLSAFPEIADQQQTFHQQDDRWKRLLSARPPSSQERKHRQHFLKRVRTFWIKDVLDQSLHHAVLIALGLHEQPDALENPWRMVIQEAEQAAHPLPPGTSILQVYDDADGQLLILGEPGAGKTTLLLELARALLDRAEGDENHAIPVVLNLSSWAQKRSPLAAWLIDELEIRYHMPRVISQGWVNADQLLLLLDGLDEVAQAHRTACVAAINAYHRVHPLVSLVVCSRRTEYLTQSMRVLLQKAVLLQPLTLQQIDEYLASGGEQLAAARIKVHADPGLQELAATPLMLSMLTLAYQGKSLENFATESTPEILRQQVFEAYVQRMLQRRGINARYTAQQAIGWLSWLAAQMTRQSLTQFEVWRMGENWLPDRWPRRIYAPIFSMVLFGSISVPLSALVYSLLTGLIRGPFTLLAIILVDAALWFAGGFLGQEMWSLFSSIFKERILPLRDDMKFDDFIDLNRVITNAEFFVTSRRTLIMLKVITWLLRIWLLTLLVVVLLSIPLIPLVAVLASLSWIFKRLEIPNTQWISFRRINPFTGGRFARNIILGSVFSLAGVTPWRYIRFLDYATERILLYKTGNSYMFIHRLLLDYFAALDDTPIPPQTLTSEIRRAFEEAMSDTPTA